jgi:hypothetical protein
VIDRSFFCSSGVGTEIFVLALGTSRTATRTATDAASEFPTEDSIIEDTVPPGRSEVEGNHVI